MERPSLGEKKRNKSDVAALYGDVMRRLVGDTAASCPVDIAAAFLGLCSAQSCGKCTPCRVGLSALSEMFEQILDGKADRNTLDCIVNTAEGIMKTADCAIGVEAARLVRDSVKAFSDEYLSHIENGCCEQAYGEPVPCVSFCPAHVDIPGYIALVNNGDYDNAVRLIRKDNPFPSACALICEHPCELHCRRNYIDDAVNIRGLKRMAVDNANAVPVPRRAEPTGKKVSVIGGGPAGLSAAYYLELMGHDVTVYERRKQLGGMLRYGIPAYRLPRKTLDAEINTILSVGIKAVTDIDVGTDITFDEIRKNSDAVYLSIGAHTDNKLGIEGENGKGVMSAVELLRGIGDGKMPDFAGKKVVVVGGGNVAMDCTRSAMRLGAESVTCAYRRRKEDMTALPDEIEGAIEEGCVISTLIAPQKIELDANGNVAALIVAPQMISVVSRGRPSVKDADAESIRIPADIIIVAIGQKIESEYFEGCGLTANRGRFVADKNGKLENADGVFAGGDCVTGPATAIGAIAAGKVAAGAIDGYLGFEHPVSVDVKIPAPALSVYPPCGRVKLGEREGSERKYDFELMEKPMTKEEALQESSRCLRCDKYGYGAFRKGREFKW